MWAHPINLPCRGGCGSGRTIIVADHTPTERSVWVPGEIWASYLDGLLDATDVIALATPRPQPRRRRARVHAGVS